MKLALFSLLAAALCSSSMIRADEIDRKRPIKVFILAGQSNMQGHGRIKLGKVGDLEHAAKQKEFAYLRDGKGWRERQDVWYFHKNGKGEITKGNLRTGLGANDRSIGPELAFGHLLGDHFGEQVLLIKTAWGGQALGMTFRPPSAGSLDAEFVERLVSKRKRKNPEASAKDVTAQVGSKYRQVLAEVKSVLKDVKTLFPEYRGQGYEIAGFFWHQGWNDGCSKEHSAEYESNMVHFIRDIRRDLGNDNLPFVIATSGMGGPGAKGVAGWLAKGIEPKQVAAAKKFRRCVAVPTRHFQRNKPGRQKSHWHNSAESYCLVGAASARAMIEILDKK
ncbi:MAG: sialate O-acetylesterase [Planctomycetota bacterium]